MRYQINLVRSIREMERREQQRRVWSLALSMIGGGLLALSLFYSTLQILTMESVLGQERSKLAAVKSSYKKYKSTQQIVEKADIEQLDQLQNGKIFWTRILAAIAHHLPDNYWTTEFNYDGKMLIVKGAGFLSHKQEQLIVLDNYLNELRNDQNFNAIFKSVFLNSASQIETKGQELVGFEFSATRSARLIK